MDKNILISQGIKLLENLPENKLNRAVEFIDFLSKKHKEELELLNGIEILVSKSEIFSFLNQEENLYEKSDLIEKN